MSQQPLGLVLSFYRLHSREKIPGIFGGVSTAAWACIEFLHCSIAERKQFASQVSTAAWACIEFLQIAECNEDRNRWSKVSTAAWACIEFLRLAMPVAAHGLTASQQPLGLVLSFYPIKM